MPWRGKNGPRPKYYCEKCRQMHLYSSEVGKRHFIYGKKPNF